MPLTSGNSKSGTDGTDHPNDSYARGLKESFGKRVASVAATPTGEHMDRPSTAPVFHRPELRARAEADSQTAGVRPARLDRDGPIDAIVILTQGAPQILLTLAGAYRLAEELAETLDAISGGHQP